MNGVVAIDDREFLQIRELLHERIGVDLSPAKKNLVRGRLIKRLRHYNLSSFGEYFDLATRKNNQSEMQTLVDLLTTNETYFFREEKHFDFLSDKIIPQIESGKSFDVWSAAASSGEEAYTVSMLLAHGLGETDSWRILGTDINSEVLARARRAHYPIDAAAKIPPHLLKAYCLKGVGDHEGTFTLEERLRRRIEFKSLNLNGAWNGIGQFDLVFLRNVMIYFDLETKQRLVEKMYQAVKPGGYFIVGHSEGLASAAGKFKLIQPSVYQRIS